MIRLIAPLLAALTVACTPVVPANNATETPSGQSETMMPETIPSAPSIDDTADQAAIDRLGGGCDAARVQDMIGKAYTDDLATAALAATGARTIRVIRPGIAVTMDYRTDRLNIEVDDKSVITTIRCG